MASASACGSDDDSSSSATTGSGGAVSKENQEFCTEMQNLVEQSSPDDLSALANLASFTDAVTSLTATAPEAILPQMQTLATASQAKLEAVQQDPSATIPPPLADQAQAANEDVAKWVADNCGGLQVPTIDL
jgi:hypothetical protein